MKQIYGGKFRASLGKEALQIIKSHKLETIPFLAEMTKERFELLTKTALLESDYKIKNLDAFLDISKILLSVSATIFVASNVIPFLQKNLNIVVGAFLISLVILFITLLLRKKEITKIINSLNELQNEELTKRETFNSTMTNLIQKEVQLDTILLDNLLKTMDEKAIEIEKERKRLENKKTELEKKLKEKQTIT